jgi:hypothetical protein
LSTEAEEEEFDSNNRGKMNPNSFDIPARLVLYFLSWSGFLVSFMMRNDVSSHKVDI